MVRGQRRDRDAGDELPVGGTLVGQLAERDLRAQRLAVAQVFDGDPGAGGGLGDLGTPAAGAGAAATLGNLDFLRNNAQFQQLRQVVQQQPQMLEPILQQLGAGNPLVAQLIANNPEEFLELLGEDGDNDMPLQPGMHHYIPVTPEERDAIERVSLPDARSQRGFKRWSVFYVWGFRKTWY